eukprot:PITA_31941
MVYLHNRSLHHILGMKTPEEAFSHKRLDVGHYRIFGSSVYFHVTKDAQKKLELTIELGILVGYTDTPHTYQLHAKVPGVETSTQAESSRDGQKRTREAFKLLEDARENVGAPSSHHRQRRSPERYTRYMAITRGCVEIEPSYFEEAVQESILVDVMVEEYVSIVCNSVWDVVLRPENKLVVSSRWLYKVKQAADGSVEKHKARFVACGFSQVEEDHVAAIYILTEEQDVDILTKAL